MKKFGDALHQLMELKGVIGVQLSAETGLTITSFSRLLNGQSGPRYNRRALRNGQCHERIVRANHRRAIGAR